MGRNVAVLLVFGLTLVLAPGAAAATTLYATPSPGVGAPCSAAGPCDLETALDLAVDGDTVVIGVGTYQDAEGDYFDDGKDLTIRGAAIGIGRPVIEGTFELSGSGSHISDVELRADTFVPALELGQGAAADRVLAVNTEGDGCSIEESATTIANSLCISNNPDGSNSGMASQGNTGPLAAHNVTLLGDTGYFSNNSADPALTLADSIAMTTHPDTGNDASFGQGKTSAINSYFATKNFPDGVTETNQLTEEPIFRGPGDFREAPDSPSINAGSDAAGPGELDLNGNLRKLGTHTDVGAYEFVPAAPLVTNLPAAPLATTSATVNATIDTLGGQTYYHLEYGPTAAHGSSTPTQVLPASTSPAKVQFPLGGLTPGSTIPYSIVASSDGGSTTTADASFVTAAASAPPPPAAPKLAPSLLFKKAKGGKPKGQPLLDRPAIALQVGCGPVDCRATAKATVKIGGKGFGALRGPKQPLGLQAGKQGTLKVSSTASLRTRVREYLLAHPAARAKVLVTATFTAADGTSADRTLTIPVRPLAS